MERASDIDIPTVWKEAGQGQVLRFEADLSPEEKASLLSQLAAYDPLEINQVFKASQGSSVGEAEEQTEPVATSPIANATSEQVSKWQTLGMDAIREKKVVIVLFAGGQGTRLGSPDPKGMFDVGLPSGKSLFQLQAERISKLGKLAASGSEAVQIPWYVMTSTPVHDRTVKYFSDHDFFGLEPSSVHFFKQADFPVLTPEGKVVLKTKSEIMTSPNGNGGVWKKLHTEGLIDQWKKDGIEWIATYGVDNILVKVADPVFLGFCIEQKLEIGAKVVRKSAPEERVGVLAKKGSGHCVLEYTEIDETRRNATDAEGKLLYSASHLVINNYSIDFLQNFCNTELSTLPYHVAKKKGVSLGEEKSIWKMELFAFDAFAFSGNVKALECDRSEEFSPLKNSLSAERDNAATCREAISSLHKSWLAAAGCEVTGPHKDEVDLCEISPLLSYAGEGLESFKGTACVLPLSISKLQ